MIIVTTIVVAQYKLRIEYLAVTRTRLKSMTVCKRCAMVKMVQPSKPRRMVSWTLVSVAMFQVLGIRVWV